MRYRIIFAPLQVGGAYAAVVSLERDSPAFRLRKTVVAALKLVKQIGGGDLV